MLKDVLFTIKERVRQFYQTLREKQPICKGNNTIRFKPSLLEKKRESKKKPR